MSSFLVRNEVNCMDTVCMVRLLPTKGCGSILPNSSSTHTVVESPFPPAIPAKRHDDKATI